ncbi:MAG: hypothetical protein P0S95_01740 [Rhabdochlamydiaceae bacterium]|nr:hypothetical protein [Candidatus Amphrikana amoebophyrae]
MAIKPDALSALYKTYPSLKEQMGPCIVLKGAGWSAYTEVKGITPTFLGLKNILQLKNIDAIILSNKAEIESALSHLRVNQKIVAIIKYSDISSLYNVDEIQDPVHHSVTICMTRDCTGHTITVLDGCAQSCIDRGFFSRIVGDSVRLFYSSHVRQGDGEVTCSAIAISDCAALTSDAKLLDKIQASAQKMGKLYVIKHLPRELLISSTQKLAMLDLHNQMLIDHAKGKLKVARAVKRHSCNHLAPVVIVVAFVINVLMSHLLNSENELFKT